jgi:hypothetical protein
VAGDGEAVKVTPLGVKLAEAITGPMVKGDVGE